MTDDKMKAKAVKAWGLVWKGHTADRIVFPLYNTKEIAKKWCAPHMRVVRVTIEEVKK